MADKNVYNSSYTGKQVDDAVSRLINVTAPVLTEDNIVQATGDSSSNIMSQKAVTDALTRNIPTKVSQLENDSGYITETELEGKDYATNTKVNNLQTQVTQNKDNLNSEITNRESADSQLQNNIDNEASERNTADTNLQTQITNNDTDISNLQSTKLDSSKADKNVVSGVTVSANDDNVNVVRAYVNLSTQATSSDAETFPLANDTTAGLMSKADYSQIRDNKARIEQLEGQNVRLTYTASTSPTASQIEAFVKAGGYTDTSKWIYIGVVVSGTNHIWRYYTNTATWADIGVDTVNQFTNSIAGIIKGSATAGKVYAETDGTGSVYGWDNLNTSVSNNTSAISTETTNRQTADNTLQSNIDTLDGQVVKLDTDQTIPSIKTFSNYIKTPQVASVEGKGLVRYKGTEGKSVYGNDSTGNVLMGNTDRPSYSKSGSDFNGNELALLSDLNDKLKASNIKAGTNITVSTSGNDVTINAETGEGGTNVYVNNVKQDSVSFTSDPQTQISTKINSDQIVQSIGDSSSNIMSQKAVTDALSIKANCDASNLDDTNIESWANKCQFERTELFYDCSSSDSNLNWGKTSGIIGGVYENATKVNECLSKYRKLYFYIQADNNYITNQVFPLALDKTQKWGGYTAGYSFPGTYTYSTTKKYVRYTFRGTVSQSEQKFQFDFGSGDDLRNYNDNSNYFVRAIWGVFK